MAPKVSKEVIATIRNGKDAYDENGMAAVNATELTLIKDALYTGWFYPKKEKLQETFDGHTRAYVAGSGYFLGDTTHWDIGAIYEYIDGLTTARAYIIAAQRDKFGVYAGVDVEHKGFTAGAMVNVTEASHGVAVSAGYTWNIEGVPWNLSAMGYSRSQDLPEYSVPLYRRTAESGMPEFGVMMLLTIGVGRGMMPIVSPAPGVQNSPYP